MNIEKMKNEPSEIMLKNESERRTFDPDKRIDVSENARRIKDKGDKFDYINCPSIYASSTYIVSNFGVTPWACAYLEVDTEGNYTSGLIRE